MRLLSSIATVALLTAAFGCGQSQNLGGSGAGGNGGAGGSGAGSPASGPGGGGNDPCAGKQCGEACSNCTGETCPAIYEECDAAGECVSGGVECEGTCEYGGQVYPVGASFPSTDGCNSCSCLGDGSVACTDMACQQCGGLQGETCDAGSFCDIPIGVCQSPDASGVCKAVPQGCDKSYAPVCGCDGVTYGNACMAAAAAMSIDHDGPCAGQACGGLGGVPCDAGAYCHYPDGTCQVEDIGGACEPQPQGCPDNYDPVCGCDGTTYGNHCEAAAVAMSVDHLGECK